MSDRPWWSHIVQWGLWFVVMSLVMGWIARSRKKATPTEEGRSYVLTITRAYPIIGYICVGIFLFAAVASALSGTVSWAVPTLFVGFASLGVPMVLESRARHEVTEEGIRYRGMSKNLGLVPWEEMRSAKYAMMMKWLVVETQSVGTLRFSAGLHGWETLAKALLENLPSLSANEMTRKVLEEARDGNPPSVWQ